MKESSIRTNEKAKAALRMNFGGVTDRQGYLDWPERNLVQGVRLDQFESDLRRGDGNELRMKFCAVHSSAALAVNCFAPFKDRPKDLFLLGQKGAESVEFEKRFHIVPGRRPSNLDVWIDRGASAVAIESKLLEYFEPKKPNFAEAYEQMKPPASEACWWNLYLESKGAASQYLDRAQLVKHYFGLRRLQATTPQAPTLSLLYLFWEPMNWQQIDECIRHRKQVKEFADQVAGSLIPFHWTSYSELWQEWMEVPALARHAANLKARYEVRI